MEEKKQDPLIEGALTQDFICHTWSKVHEHRFCVRNSKQMITIYTFMAAADIFISVADHAPDENSGNSARGGSAKESVRLLVKKFSDARRINSHNPEGMFSPIPDLRSSIFYALAGPGPR